jgi:hypothetical protein
MLLSAITFTVAFVGMVVCLLKVHRLYRGAGFTLDKARKEFSDSKCFYFNFLHLFLGIMSDRNVQTAVNQAGRAAATAAGNFFNFLFLLIFSIFSQQRSQSVCTRPILTDIILNLIY